MYACGMDNIQRLERDLTLIAKEPVIVEECNGMYYAFGSEIATLRMFAKYNTNGAVHNKRVRVGFSGNRGRFFFSIET